MLAGEERKKFKLCTSTNIDTWKSAICIQSKENWLKAKILLWIIEYFYQAFIVAKPRFNGQNTSEISCVIFSRLNLAKFHVLFKNTNIKMADTKLNITKFSQKLCKFSEISQGESRNKKFFTLYPLPSSLNAVWTLAVVKKSVKKYIFFINGRPFKPPPHSPS